MVKVACWCCMAELPEEITLSLEAIVCDECRQLGCNVEASRGCKKLFIQVSDGQLAYEREQAGDMEAYKED